ncbi:MAG: hypothetical protein RQ856_00725 [Candidatus Izemoplasmatales bacterium]|nr:hypothetical protein [Candidatus Izemoplasmatales bacterium]
MVKRNLSFLIAKRNISANKKTTLVIIMTLSLIFAVFIMMLGIRGIYKSVFTREAQSNYPGIDIVISYDEYSPARFINKRDLKDTYEDIVYALAFFNLQVLTESTGSMYYTNMISSLPHEFELLADEDINLGLGESIITESYASEHNLEVGDNFSFYVLNVKYEYKITSIIEDQGVFSGNTFYIDKTEILAKIYDIDLFDNFGNIVYLKTDNTDGVYKELKEDSNYLNYNIKMVVDDNKIDDIVTEYTSMISVAGLIVIISLAIVLNSLFVIVLRDIYLEIGVFETLGDSERLGYKVCSLQWSLYILTSFIIGIIISHLVVNIGASFYGVNSFIGINPLIILGSLLIISTIILIKNLSLLKNHYSKNTIQKIRDKRYVLAKYNLILVLLGSIVLASLIILEPFSIKYNSLFIVILSMYIGMNLVVVVLKLLSRLFGRRKSIFSLFNCKHMDNNKNIHQSLTVIFLALIVVAIMLSVRLFISQEIENVRNDNKFDILMINIYDYEPDLLDEILTYDVQSANPAIVYKDIMLEIDESEEILIKTLVSIDYNDFGNYFDYQLEDVDSVYLEHELPYIMLPKSYGLVYGFSKGDIVTLDLTSDLRDKDFVIAGFIDTAFDQFIYTNLYERLDFYDTKYNSVIINSNNTEIVIGQMINGFSSKMYYLIDGQKQLEEQLDIAANVLALFTVITIFVILSFIFVVFNNTILKFYSLKNDYAKIKVIGTSNNNDIVNLLKELLILITVLFIVGLAEIVVLSSYLRYVMLFFDYYKDLYASFESISISYSLIIFSLTVSYGYYYWKIKNISISEEIRMY